MGESGRQRPGTCRELPALLPNTIRNRFIDTQHFCCYDSRETSNEFKRWLRKQGCSFYPGRGGHLIVTLGDKMSVLPMHGNEKELGKGLVERIKKDLGLK